MKKIPGKEIAYLGELTCPFSLCDSSAVRFVEHVSEARLRYRCRKCGRTFQYDISGREDYNPYAKSTSAKGTGRKNKGVIT